jgi:hypothetical protein
MPTETSYKIESVTKTVTELMYSNIVQNENKK